MKNWENHGSEDRKRRDVNIVRKLRLHWLTYVLFAGASDC